ncbi:MAG: hypothetical protein K6T68_02890, partial [Alicyclobacillus shizuokensis]|nr:hypothetical protein [Alicyclobacillus shizuokensis]
MILGATIRLKDQFSGTLSNMQGGISKSITGIKTLNSMKAKPEIKAVDKATPTFSKVVSEMTGLGKAVAKPEIGVLDKATPSISKTSGKLKELGKAKAKPEVIVEDVTISQAIAKMRILSKMVARPVVRLKDETIHGISRIKESLLSLQGLAAVGLGAFGIHKFSEATLGAAMDFETQLVSMEHWLDGNKALAQEFTGWLDQLAAKTPFEMEDLFPSGARAIGVSEGDLDMAKRLITLAADMAGLTPGKTVKDAMEALADAQMGEFERMKEFNMKFTKEQMDAVGGFEGFLRQAESKFAGGAEKLSQTAKGRISTITDFVKTQFRSAGQGMLESLNPRLQKITDWFDNNQDTVAMWKSKLISLGRETFEGMLK